MSDSLRLDVAEEVFGGWVRAMPILKDCPRRLPAMLCASLVSRAVSARGPHGQPVETRLPVHHREGLIAHRGCIQEVGTLLGVERIYRYGPGVKEPCGPAITLCHCVVLCSSETRCSKSSPSFPRRSEPCDAPSRESNSETPPFDMRAIIASVRGKGDGMVILHKMLGGDVCTTLTALARHHRLALSPRRARWLAAMVSAVIASNDTTAATARESTREICGVRATRHARRESAPNAAGTRGNGETRGAMRAEPRGETPRDHLRDGVVSGDRHAILGGGGSPVRGETRR